MTNHLHLVARTNQPFKLSEVVRDFKKHTSKKLVAAIETIPESRREWLLHKFSYSANTSGRAKQYKLWQDGYHGICLEGGGKWMKERINYVNNNPVRQLIVANAGDYLYSSACDYEGKKGLVPVIISL
jgi:REP element-mobilizing transposase RayT